MCRCLPYFLGCFIVLHVLLVKYKVDSASNYPANNEENAVPKPAKPCSVAKCANRERCVNRKFWCKKPPCPSMMYCSKSHRDFLKGPKTCTSVTCSRGYICLVKVRGCRWNQRCRRQIARCVSEQEFQNAKVSCAGFNCPNGRRCILKESSCAHPLCKLVKSCAISKDVQAWHRTCKDLGCPSEYECFLKRPPGNCILGNSCEQTPGCTSSTSGTTSTLSTSPGEEKNTTVDHSEPEKAPRESECKPIESFHLEMLSPQNGSIYRVPIYVRSVLNKENDEGVESQMEERPTDRSIMEWLNHLRLRTGVDAISVWVKHAEENRKHGEFEEWLAAVKAALGASRFDIWLREIQELTAEHPAFQKWLENSNETDSMQKNVTVLHGQNEKSDKFDHEKAVNVSTRSPIDAYERQDELTARKIARGHSRINYGWNPAGNADRKLYRGQKVHRDFRPGNWGNETLDWYRINDSADKNDSKKNSKDVIFMRQEPEVPFDENPGPVPMNGDFFVGQKPDERGLSTLEESLKEYMDAYVDTFIENAFSKVILGERFEDDETPVNWTILEDPGPLSQDPRAPHLIDTGQNNENQTDPNLPDNSGTFQAVNDTFDSQQETTTALNPDLAIAEIDYRFDCDDQELDPSSTMETREVKKNSFPVDGTFSSGEYYEIYEENEPQEYFEGPSKYDERYLADLEMNLTDYDFQYYEYDKVIPKNTDEMKEKQFYDV